MSFNPRKAFVEKISFRRYFRSNMHRGSLLNDLLFYISYLAQKCLNLAEAFRKLSSHGFEMNFGVF